MTLTRRGRTLLSVLKVILFLVALIALYCALNYALGTWEVDGG